MKTTTFKIIISFIIGILVGWCTNEYTSQPGDVTVVVPDSIFKKEQNYIDSLRTIEKRVDNKRESLKDSIQIVVKWRTKEVENVKNLPLDSGIIFLNKKLREYED